MMWDTRLTTPPPAALKAIGGGRLKGMTDVSPQWRYRAMTEVYGLCGVGWSYTIDRLWTEPGPGGEVAAMAQISLRVGDGAPIPGVGGSMLVAAEKGGLHTSDEAYKMAVTDALSVAMKMIGVAGEIYSGNWDGSKYRTAVPQTFDAGSIKAEAMACRTMEDWQALKAKHTAAGTLAQAAPIITAEYAVWQDAVKMQQELDDDFNRNKETK